MSNNRHRPAITPFGGWVTDHQTGRLVPLETAPHILGLAPPGTGKTRRWLSQSAVLWPGPAVVSSSKDDLMQMVASRRWGKAMLLDLRPITPPHYPSAFTRCRYDPTVLISALEDAQGVAETMLAMSSVAFGGAQSRPAADNGMWENLAFAPLTCLLFAASPTAHGLGMQWVLEAAEDVSVPNQWPGRGEHLGTEPSWVTAATWCADRLFEARVRGILDMVDKQRDSVKMTVTKSLTAWLRTSIRDRDLPTFDPADLDDPHTTLYVLSPADGTVAPLPVTLMEQLIRRQRVKVGQWEEFPRLGFFIGHESRIPYDYADLLGAIAPRPALVVQPLLDRDATPADVHDAVESARKMYSGRDASDKLSLQEPWDYNRLPTSVQNGIIEWMKQNMN